MKELFIFAFIIVLGWFLFFYPPKAKWENQRAPRDPIQTTKDLPPPWEFMGFTITPRARYSVEAVVMSKHSYWGAGPEDSLSYYDLALGWGPMSESEVINNLNIRQSGRWYNYYWYKEPPISPDDIVSHSANTHIVPATPEIFDVIKRIKQYDVVSLEGYLVDIETRNKDWFWRTSLSRTDSDAGSCELLWVTKATIQPAIK